jgi:hypothetical protein
MPDSEPALSYWTVQPNRWTFAATKIRSWVEKWMEGRTLNACCGVTKLNHDDKVLRNDLQRRIEHNGTTHPTDADTHLDVRDLTDQYAPESFETIIYDPPFSEGQAKTAYNLNTNNSQHSSVYAELDTLLKPGGKIVHFGFTSTVMPPEYGYTVERVSLWNLFGRQHDWFGTIVQKPTGDEVTSAGPFTHRDEVTQNPVESIPALAETNVTAAGNDGTPIPVTYKRLSPSDDLQAAITEQVTTHLTGHTLVVGDDTAHYHDAYDGPLTVNTTSPRYAYDSQFAIQQLSEAFPNGMFDHVVLDLPADATHSNVNYEGSNTGYDTVVKDESEPLIASFGTITSVGHTATLMSQLKYDSYVRNRITILSHPAAKKDIIISTDQRQAENETFPTPAAEIGRPLTGVPADIEVDPDVSTVTPNWGCPDCHKTWYFHPALDTDCLACGAHAGNYCVDENRQPMKRIHAHRVAHWQQQHLGTHDTQSLATSKSLDASGHFGGCTPDDSQSQLANF